MYFPVTYVLEDEGLTGIAKYPVDEWVKNGEPKSTTKRWFKLCIKICSKDPTGLKTVFDIANTLEARL